MPGASAAAVEWLFIGAVPGAFCPVDWLLEDWLLEDWPWELVGCCMGAVPGAGLL